MSSSLAELQRDRLDGEAVLLQHQAQQAAQRGDDIGREVSELLATKADMVLLHPGKGVNGESMAIPRAEIVLTVLDDGRLLLKGYRMGQWNTTYANGRDSVLDEIPKLLAELREETAPFYASGK